VRSAVDTTRWLYKAIEGRPDRANLRDYGVLKSAGRHGLVLRFPARLSDTGITLDRPSG
jgi:hypothetical protein